MLSFDKLIELVIDNYKADIIKVSDPQKASVIDLLKKTTSDILEDLDHEHLKCLDVYT